MLRKGLPSVTLTQSFLFVYLFFNDGEQHGAFPNSRLRPPKHKNTLAPWFPPRWCRRWTKYQSRTKSPGKVFFFAKRQREKERKKEALGLLFLSFSLSFLSAEIVERANEEKKKNQNLGKEKNLGALATSSRFTLHFIFFLGFTLLLVSFSLYCRENETALVL